MSGLHKQNQRSKPKYCVLCASPFIRDRPCGEQFPEDHYCKYCWLSDHSRRDPLAIKDAQEDDME